MKKILLISALTLSFNAFADDYSGCYSYGNEVSTTSGTIKVTKIAANKYSFEIESTHAFTNSNGDLDANIGEDSFSLIININKKGKGSSKDISGCIYQVDFSGKDILKLDYSQSCLESYGLNAQPKQNFQKTNIKNCGT